MSAAAQSVSTDASQARQPMRQGALPNRPVYPRQKEQHSKMEKQKRRQRCAPASRHEPATPRPHSTPSGGSAGRSSAAARTAARSAPGVSVRSRQYAREQQQSRGQSMWHGQKRAAKVCHFLAASVHGQRTRIAYSLSLLDLQRTSQTESPRYASAVAFQLARTALPCRCGGGGNSEAAAPAGRNMHHEVETLVRPWH